MMMSASHRTETPAKRPSFSTWTRLATIVVLAVVAAAVMSVGRRVQQRGIERTSTFVSQLGSSDPGTVIHAMYCLTNREDRAAVPKAVDLLQSSDDYVWLNAALYLGTCRRTEAVPYLIKALRHTAWRGDAEVLRDLGTLTGEDFGRDFDAWLTWWKQQPGYRPDFDWNHHLGPAPRLASNHRPNAIHRDMHAAGVRILPLVTALGVVIEVAEPLDMALHDRNV